MRRQNTFDRIRKKQQQQQVAAAAAAAAAAAGSNLDPQQSLKDPCHNGQTPACKLLLEAVQDVFPELQQQEQYKKPQSELGQLLRKQLLKNRRLQKETTRKQELMDVTTGVFERTEPLESGGGESATTTTTSGATARKKKKRKKKKKQSQQEHSPQEGSSTAGTSSPSASTPQQQQRQQQQQQQQQPQGPPSSDDDGDMRGGGNHNNEDWTEAFKDITSDRENDENIIIEPLRDPDDDDNENSSTFIQFDDKSVVSVDLLDDVIDRSSKANEVQMQQANLEAHSLLMGSLPPDHASTTGEERTTEGPHQHFDVDSLDIPATASQPSSQEPLPPPPADGDNLGSPTRTRTSISKENLVTPVRNDSDNSLRMSSSMTTPTQKPRGSPPNDGDLLLSSPTHEWIPLDGDSETQNYHENVLPQLAVNINPLELPFLLTLKNTNPDSITTTSAIDGSLIPVEGSRNNKNDNKTTTTIADGGYGYNNEDQVRPGSYETTKALVEEWLDRLDENNFNNDKKMKEDRKHQEEYQSFLEYLQQRLYSKGNNSANNNAKKNKKNSSTSGGGGIASLQTIQDSVNGIECLSCRQDALVEFEKLKEHSSIVLNTACLKDPPKASNEEVDAAFDYVALEEGNLPTTLAAEAATTDESVIIPEKTNNFCLVFSESLSKQQQSQKSSKNSNCSSNYSKQLCLESLTSTHLDTLVEQWLPCGIEEDIMVCTTVGGGNALPTLTAQHAKEEIHGGQTTTASAVVLNPEVVEALQTVILQKDNETQERLLELQSEGKEIMDKYENAVAQSRVRNLEFSSFPQLKQCDALCREYLTNIILLLKRCTLERSHALADTQLHLWTILLEGLNNALDACDVYYTKIGEELPDQHGVLPRMFVSLPLRNLFQTLVKEKIRLWTNIGTSFSDVLLSSSNHRILREWYTRYVWDVYERQSGGDGGAGGGSNVAAIFEREEELEYDLRPDTLDDKCYDILANLSAWTDTIMGGRISEIQKDRMKQTSEILKLLQSTVEPLSKEYSTVERFFSKDRNQYFASLRSNIVLAKGVQDRMRLIDHNEIKFMATGVIVMWRHVRTMQSRMNITPTSSPSTLPEPLPSRPLPLQLKRWYMLQDDCRSEWGPGGDLFVLGHHQMYCQVGTGGKRRLTCILAGLIYKWLENQCREWKAAKAEQELLFGFDDLKSTPTTATSTAGGGDSASPDNNSAQQKSSKKKRKKKSKASSAVATGAADPNDNPSLPKGTNNTANDDQRNCNKHGTIVKPARKIEEGSSTNGTSTINHERKADIVPNDTQVEECEDQNHVGGGEDTILAAEQKNRGSKVTVVVANKGRDDDTKGPITEVSEKQKMETITPSNNNFQAHHPMDDDKLEEEMELVSQEDIDQLCFENVKLSDKGKEMPTPADFLIGRLEVVMRTAKKSNSKKTFVFVV